MRIPAPSDLLAAPLPLVPLLARGFLEWVRAIGEAVGGDLPEEDPAEPSLHGPLGLGGDTLGVVVPDHDRAIGRDEPGVLGLVVPLPGPALLLPELVEVAVIALRHAGPGCAFRGRIRLRDG